MALGRSVGNISVTVDADTGRLKAQLTKDGTAAGLSMKRAIEKELDALKTDIDERGALTAAKRAAELIKTRMEAQLQGIDVGLDTTEARNDLRRIEAEIEAADAAINVTISERDMAEINARLHEVEDTQVQLRLDTHEATLELFAFKEKTEAEKIQEEVDLDTLRAQIKLDKFRLEQEANALDLDVDISLGAEEAKMIAFRRQLAGDAFGGGQDAGKSFADGFGSGGSSFLPGQVAEWLPLIAAALEPLAPLVEGIAGGAVQVLSSAFSALAGSAGALAPIIAGLGVTLGAVVIGSLGVTKGFSAVSKEFAAAADEGRAFDFQAKAIQKSLGALGPAAQGVVRAFADLFPQLKAIQNLIAEQLFAGLGNELTRLSTTAIPNIGNALVQAAGVANRFFTGIARAAETIDFSGTFATVAPALDSLGRAITNVVRSIEPFLKAAAPAARELAKWIEEGAQSLLRMVQRGAQSGAITKFLLEGIDSLKDWARLVESVGKALFTLFQQGKEGGDGLVQSLTRVVDKWNEWMQSGAGQSALKDFFTTSRQLLSDMVPLLKGLADGLGSIFTGAAEGSFRALSAGLGDILRVIGELIGVINQANITGALVAAISSIARSLEAVLPQIERFVAAFGDSFTQAMTGLAAAIGPVIGLLGNLVGALTPLAPLVAGIATAFVAWKAITGIVSAVTSGLGGLNPVILGIGAAIGIALIAYQAFTAKSKEIAARTSEVTAALNDQVNAMLETATQSSAAALGMDALSKSLANTGEDGEKLTKSLGTLGLTVDDAADALIKVHGESKQSAAGLEELARQAGLSSDEAKFLAAAVNSTDDSFSKWLHTTQATEGGLLRTNPALQAMAEKFGVTEKGAGALSPRLVAIGDALEEVQDQSAKTDIDKTIQDFLKLSAASSDTNQALLKQVGGAEALTKTGQPLLDVYNQYTALLGQNAAQSNEAAAAQLKVNDALTQQAAGATSTTKAMTDLDSALSQSAGGFKSISDAVFGIAGPMTETEAAMAGVGQAADAGARAADAFSKALDKLLNPVLDQQAALSDYQAAVDDLSASLKENGKTLDLGTQKGRDNSEQIRTNVKAITDWGEAALKNGAKQEDVVTIMNNMRSELIGQVGAFNTGTQSAEEYVNALGLTPDTITTVVETPGLLDASRQILDYDFDLDGIADSVDTSFSATNLDSVRQRLTDYGIDLTNVPDSVLTEFLQQNWEQVHGQAQQLATDANTVSNTPATVNVGTSGVDTTNQQVDNVFQKIGSLDTLTGTPTVAIAGTDTADAAVDTTSQKVAGLDQQTAQPSVEVINNAIVMIQLGAIQQQVQALNKLQANPAVTIPNYATVVTQIVTMMALIVQLGRAHAEPSISVPSYGTAIGQISAVALALVGLDRMNATPSVRIDGIDNAINQVNTLARAIAGLQSKTVTVTTNNVTTNTGGMTGMMISQPMTLNVGELGLREALIPLDLPLGQVDPSVRGMAALLRGQAVPAGSTIGRQVNVYNSIEVQSSSADPLAIATQVMNRAAAMAN